MTTAQRILYFLSLGLYLRPRRQTFYGRVLPAERML